MKKSFLVIILAIAILAGACQDKEREQQLTVREQALLAKEEQFAFKEAEYQLLLKMRDSVRASALAANDTVLSAPFVLPGSIAGQWSSKVVCTESSCADYAVGDQRTDTWEFGQDSTHVLVKIINGKNLVRVYTGNFDGSQISLAFRTDSAAAKQVDMQVVLNDIKDGKIRGTRAIAIDNKCTARFTVELDRAKLKE